MDADSKRKNHLVLGNNARPKGHLHKSLRGLMMVIPAIALLLVFQLQEYLRYPLETPHYDSQEEMNLRSTRFPSVKDRVKAYMSNWFLPPCENASATYRWMDDASNEVQLREIASANRTLRPRTFSISTKVDIARVLVLEEEQLQSCFEKSWGIRFYCFDALDSLVETHRELSSVWDDAEAIPPPLLAQFGDEAESIIEEDGLQYLEPRLPHFKKIRQTLSREQLKSVTTGSCSQTNTVDSLQPILWNLNVFRHYGPLSLIPSLDRPWDQKQDAAIFRGALTGRPADDLLDQPNDDNALCQSLARCRLVYQNANSALVDAKLTTTANRLPDTLDGISLTAPVFLKEDLLAYKGLIFLQGNDVASGLKWALLSRSVVLMPPPTITSFALEEQLEPWVHYIPLEDTDGDLRAKVHWMIDNSEQAKEISHRATLYILDLVYHPDVAQEEAAIQKEILWRYRAHFRDIEDEGSVL